MKKIDKKWDTLTFVVVPIILISIYAAIWLLHLLLN